MFIAFAIVNSCASRKAYTVLPICIVVISQPVVDAIASARSTSEIYNYFPFYPRLSKDLRDESPAGALTMGWII